MRAALALVLVAATVTAGADNGRTAPEQTSSEPFTLTGFGKETLAPLVDELRKGVMGQLSKEFQDTMDKTGINNMFDEIMDNQWEELAGKVTGGVRNLFASMRSAETRRVVDESLDEVIAGANDAIDRFTGACGAKPFPAQTDAAPRGATTLDDCNDKNKGFPYACGLNSNFDGDPLFIATVGLSYGRSPDKLKKTWKNGNTGKVDFGGGISLTSGVSLKKKRPYFAMGAGASIGISIESQSSDGGDVPPPDSNDPGPGECNNDNACADTEECNVLKKCVERPTCTTSADCAREGYACTEGRCTSTATNREVELAHLRRLLAQEEGGAPGDTGLKPEFNPDNWSMSLGFDFMGSISSFGGWAFTLSIHMPDKIHFGLKEIHVSFSHPHWLCLLTSQTDIVKWMKEVRVSGWGFTAFEGSFTDMARVKRAMFHSSIEAFDPTDPENQILTDVDGWAPGLGLSFNPGLTIYDKAGLGRGDSSSYGGKWTPGSCPGNFFGRESSETQKLKRQSQVLGFEDNFDNVVSLMQKAAPILLDGELTTPFCLGQCPVVDVKRGISGTGRVGVARTCNGVEMSVFAETITTGSVLSIITSAVDKKFADTLINGMGPVAAVGVQQAELILATTTSGVSITALGNPLLPSGDFARALSFLEDITVQASAGVSWDGTGSLTLAAGTKPDLRERVFAIRNAAGTLGMSVYTSSDYIIKSGQLTQRFGVQFPMRLCVESCNKPYASRRHLDFEGQLDLVLSPTAQLVEGSIIMDGTWNKALGLKFLHLSNVVLGIGMDLKTVIPSKLVIGGAVCLGAEDVCLGSAAGNKVAGRAYLGVSATEPAENWFVAMVESLTVDGLVGVVATFAPSVSQVMNKLPSKLRESGLYPFEKTVSQRCINQRKQKADDDAARTTLDKECFAYIGFSPLVKKTLSFRDGNIEIDQGLAFQGRLNFFGWNIGVKAQISETRLYIDARMDNVKLRFAGRDLLTIGERLNSNKKAIGGARFMVDLKATGSALVSVSGAFSIGAPLNAYGSTTITLNSEIFEFTSNINFFDGALTQSTTVQWNWDLSYFKLQLGTIRFALGLVTMKEMICLVDTTSDYALFDMKVTALYMANLQATAEVRGKTTKFWLETTVAGCKADVNGVATFGSSFKNSRFDIDVNTNFGACIGSAIAGVANAAVNAAAQGVQEAWTKVSDKVNALYGSVKNEFNNALRGIKNRMITYLNDMHGFINDVSRFMSRVPALRDAAKIGKDIANGVKDVWDKITFGVEDAFTTKRKVRTVEVSGTDDFGCQLYKKKWKKCKGLGKLRTCKNKEGNPYGERTCYEAAAKAAWRVEQWGNQMKGKQDVLDASKANNKGYEYVLSLSGGSNIPAPGISRKNVRASGGVVNTAFSVSTKKLRTTGSGLLNANLSPTLNLDFSTMAKYEDSISAATQSIGAAIGSNAIAGQEGVTTQLTNAGN